MLHRQRVTLTKTVLEAISHQSFIILAAVFYCGYKDGGGVALGLKYVFYIICAALLFVFGMGIFVSIAAVIANNIWLLGLIPVAIIIFANWSK